MRRTVNGSSAIVTKCPSKSPQQPVILSGAKNLRAKRSTPQAAVGVAARKPALTRVIDLRSIALSFRFASLRAGTLRSAQGDDKKGGGEWTKRCSQFAQAGDLRRVGTWPRDRKRSR